jgi:Gas vesicle synthesis protein GvpL/GvpF
VSDDLHRLARAAAPDVLAAALDRARAQAVARLADLLTDAIVAEALNAPSVQGRSATPAAAEALYAYAITSAGVRLPEETPALTEGARIERVTAGDLALLVSRVHPDELRIDEDDLSENGRLATLARGHDAVVRAIAGVGPVLPLRFGTVVPDEDAAARLLEEHAAAARAQLRRVADSREWGVKLVRRVGEPVAAGPRPIDREDVSGTEYLSRRRQALQDRDAAERSAAEAVGLLENTLRPHVRESLRRGGSPGSSLLLDLAFLVPPESETAFLAAAAELREQLQPDALEVEVSGPWPAYSFATLEPADA